jgi:hypothetical protein
MTLFATLDDIGNRNSRKILQALTSVAVERLILVPLAYS